MKKDTHEIILHANAVAVVVFCFYYSLLSYYPDTGIFAGVIVSCSALFILYLPDLITYPKMPEDVPKEAKRGLKVISIIASWALPLGMFGIHTDNNRLLTYGIILLALDTMYFAFYARKWKRILSEKEHGVN